MLWFALVVVCALCAPILRDMARLALSRSLYSHALLVPLVSFVLIYRRRNELKLTKRPSFGLPLCLVLVSLPVLLLSCIPALGLTETDALSLRMFAFVVLVFAVFAAFLGRAGLRPFCFPLFFLLFMVPMPEFMEKWFDVCLLKGTIAVLPALLSLSGTPFVQDGTTFALPGLTIEVARECSGIRSSLVLMITGVLMGHVTLKTPWRKVVMAGIFYPVGVFRNAFRILTVTLLTMHVNAGVIDGPLHSRGGPLFFALSLIPFFLILWWLVRSEQKSTAKSRRDGENAQ